MLTCHFCTTPVALSFCTAQSKHLTMNDTFTSMYVTGQHKNKASLRQTRVYYPFASTHMVNTQLLRVQNVHTNYKILQIVSRVFEFALAKFARNPRKLMYREYFRFYSIYLVHNVFNSSNSSKLEYFRPTCIYLKDIFIFLSNTTDLLPGLTEIQTYLIDWITTSMNNEKKKRKKRHSLKGPT